MTDEEMKQWVDAADYEKLLLKWRDAARNDPFFQDEMCEYYFKKIIDKREEVGEMEHRRVFKLLSQEEGDK